jgi:hypothetical protein
LPFRGNWSISGNNFILALFFATSNYMYILSIHFFWGQCFHVFALSSILLGSPTRPECQSFVQCPTPIDWDW